MTRNYRVIYNTFSDDFAVHEVYYDGFDFDVSEDPIFPRGKTIDDLRADIELFQGALSLPVLKKGLFGKPETE